VDSCCILCNAEKTSGLRISSDIFESSLMRIIYFSLDYTPHDHRFLSALSASAHKIFYVRLQQGPRQTESRPVPENIEIVQWAGGQKPFAWSNLPKLTLAFRDLVKKIKPDLIHAGPIQTCALIAVLSGFRPLLTMSWGFDLMKDVHRGKWWAFATRYTLKRSTYFTSDAQVTRDMAVKYGMDPAKTVVFPWGVDLEHFKPAEDEEPKTKDGGRRTKDGGRRTKDGGRRTKDGGRRTKDEKQTVDDALSVIGHSSSVVRPPSKGFTLFCNRSWEANYGVDVLARAFVTVARQREDVSLMLLGGGSQGPTIRKILLSGGVEDRVSFPGQINNADLPRYYHMADIYISPSHVDGSSVSLMEALACGLPCLVSDIPANKEWVQEGYNGWLFPDGDHDALAAKILQAIEQREKLTEIAQKARATAEEKADWPKNVQVLLDAYEKTAFQQKG
jgi:L-malate glycosyltransferase